MTRPLLLAVASLLLSATPRPCAAASALVADLTEHFVAITAGFTGTSVTLFGATDGDGDLVVTVRGPARQTVIRRKSHLAGLWLNTRSVAFADVPGYYALISSRPVETILTPTARKTNQIGIDAITLRPVDKDDVPAAADYRAAMIADFERTGLYDVRPGQVTFMDRKLFRATLAFPANVPTGSYSVDLFLVKGGEIAATETIPLTIAETGAEATLNDMVANYAPAYGLLTVLAAAAAGWFASFIGKENA